MNRYYFIEATNNETGKVQYIQAADRETAFNGLEFICVRSEARGRLYEIKDEETAPSIEETRALLQAIAEAPEATTEAAEDNSTTDTTGSAQKGAKVAKVAQFARRAIAWTLHTCSSAPRIYRAELRVLDAVAGWMDRHPIATNTLLFALAFAFVLEVFFFAPID